MRGRRAHAPHRRSRPSPHRRDPFLDGGCRPPHAYSSPAATAALRSARRRLTRPRPVPLPRQPCAETIVEAEEEDIFYIYLPFALTLLLAIAGALTPPDPSHHAHSPAPPKGHVHVSPEARRPAVRVRRRLLHAKSLLQAEANGRRRRRAQGQSGRLADQGDGVMLPPPERWAACVDCVNFRCVLSMRSAVVS